MEFPMWNRKRLLLHRFEHEAPLCTKKRLTQLDKTDTSDRVTYQVTNRSCGRPGLQQPFVNEEVQHLINNKHLTEKITCWADTQHSVKKVLELLKFRQASSDIFLNGLVNKKFLDFHSDITEECGEEGKQHSWAVIEKQEEIVMYGPYYPNYNKGEHSEDIILRQTQELLESEAVSEGWKVFVFTMNSPCLARNTGPCMLNLVYKAWEWRSVYGVKTHIGYVRCWGFKGNKETQFRCVNYQQLDSINHSEDHKGYVSAAGKITDLNPLCESLYSAVKDFLRSGQVNFPLVTNVQGLDWKSYFKSVHSIVEDKPEEEKKVFTQEVNTMIEAAQAQLSGQNEKDFEKYLEIGEEFALDYTFSQQVSDALSDQMRLTFQQCWREMVQEKYAEFIREKLTEDFNQYTVELFIKDIEKVTKEYLEIGRIQFSKDDSKAPQSL